MINWPQVLCAGAVGAVLASFLATAVLRNLTGESAVFGRSRCDECRRPLALLETTPLVSFVASRGACRHCSAPIDRVHPWAEAAGAVAGASIVLLPSWPAKVGLGVMAAALLPAAIVDLRTRRLPDVLTTLVAAASATLAISRGVDALLVGLAAAVITFAVLQTVRGAFFKAQGDPGLGYGDVKLVAALALGLGIATSWMVALAALIALAAAFVGRPADGKLPFGPMLALAGWGVTFSLEFLPWPR